MKPSVGISAVWGQAGEVIRAIELWLEAREGKRFRLAIKPMDQVRMLKLRVWCIRHCTDIWEILDLVIPVLRSRMQYQKTRYGLGVSAITLTGSIAERILIEKLAKEYPNGENVIHAQQARQQEQLDAEARDARGGLELAPVVAKNARDYESLDDFLNEYEAKVMRARKTYYARLDEPWRKRKAYRYNPWA